MSSKIVAFVAEDFSLFEAFLYTVCAYSKTNFAPKTNENLFNGHLYTEYAYSKTELESQGDDRSLERHCGQGNRPMSFREVKRRGNPLNRNKKPFYDCHKPHSPSRLLPHREFALSVRARTRTPATVAPNYLLGESWAGHPHPIHYC